MTTTLASILDRTVTSPGELSRVASRYDRLRQQFAVFCEGLEYFSSQRCDVPGVTLSSVTDGRRIVASLADTSVSFNFSGKMTGDNTFVGRVICRLENEEFRRNGDLPILGTFTFNGNGKTDLVSQDHSDDDVTMDDYAVLIVLHYLKLALKYDPPK